MDDIRALLDAAGSERAAIGALMRMWTETDVRDLLPSIKVPTVVIHRTWLPTMAPVFGSISALWITDEIAYVINIADGIDVLRFSPPV